VVRLLKHQFLKLLSDIACRSVYPGLRQKATKPGIFAFQGRFLVSHNSNSLAGSMRTMVSVQSSNLQAATGFRVVTSNWLFRLERRAMKRRLRRRGEVEAPQPPPRGVNSVDAVFLQRAPPRYEFRPARRECPLRPTHKGHAS
jgi:hypothetical protein